MQRSGNVFCVVHIFTIVQLPKDYVDGTRIHKFVLVDVGTTNSFALLDHVVKAYVPRTACRESELQFVARLTGAFRISRSIDKEGGSRAEWQ